MESIALTLSKKVIKPSKSKRPVNPRYEQAAELTKQTGIPTLILLRMIKQYGTPNVLRMGTFLADYPNKDGKPLIGMGYWFLKNRATPYNSIAKNEANTDSLTS
jgi:hypothetical protein